MKTLLLFLALLVSHTASAASQPIAEDFDSLNWQLEKEKDDIKVSTAAVPHSPYRAYLAETVIDAATYDLVAIIRNPATCSEWVYRCGESYRHKQETPNTDLVYTASDMPFPVKDRDTLARITWHEDPATNVIKAVGVATSDVLAPTSKHIRIEDATVIWELTPLADGSTRVRTFGHADPGGTLPTWLINQLSTEVPVKTLNGLKALVAEYPSGARQDYRNTVTGL
ncbi:MULTISPECIES: START domain-containing protein [unclassified Ketobacter]|uniref:START domain-containing protein n=1 Tax=unclassified Ketobacter TaxID=2639109 RepID=UPI0025B8BF57|nr:MULTISPECIES: START domain-containing protein [unclassified Ketobacter]